MPVNLKNDMTKQFDPSKDSFGFLRAQYASISFTQKTLGADWFIYNGPVLAHYTNLQGMVGIVETGGFWLSDIRFLNDVEEFDNGRKLARELIETLMRRPRHRSFNSILKSAYELLGQQLQEPYYVASFSRNPDSLEQWRAYANSTDGVALVFQNGFGPKGPSHFALLPLLRPTIAIYDDLRKRRVLLNAISKFSCEYKKDLAAGEVFFTSNASLWAQHLVEAMSHAFLTFKHTSFQAEDEIRVVAHFSQKEEFGGIKHRVRNGRIIPYLCSSSLYAEEFIKAGGSRKLPLREVVVGPMAKQEITIQSIKVFLANMGYEDVTVRPSTVPYRG